VEFEAVGTPNLSATATERVNEKPCKIVVQDTNLDPKLYYHLAPVSLCLLLKSDNKRCFLRDRKFIRS